MRFATHSITCILAALAAVLLAMPGIAAAAQVEGSHAVGNSVLTFDGSWELHADFSNAESAFLAHTTMQPTTFVYTETSEVSTVTADAAMDQFSSAFIDVFDPGTSRLVASDVMPDGTGWRLYAANISGIPAAVVVTGNVTAEPGTAVLSLLMAPAGSIDLALEDVQDGIQIDGRPAPPAALDPARIAAAVEGGADPSATTATQPAVPLPTSTPATAATTPVVQMPATTPVATAPVATQAPASTDQRALIVAGASFTWNDRWILDTVNSEADGRTYWDAADGSATWFGYLPSEAGAGDALAQLDAFNQWYFGADFVEIRQVGREAISPTGAWSLTTATLQGKPLAVLTYADTGTAGQLRVQMLVGDPADAAAALMDVHRSVRIDGAGVLDGVDPARVMVMLNGDSAATMPAGTGPTPAVATTTAGQATVPQTAVVNGVDYRALDAPSGCDRIGWAIVDPSQRPASEAEIDHQGACAGGVSYVAQCGTEPGERADTRSITCDITALVIDGPQEFGFDMFTLVDGNGDAEYVDFGMSFGKDGLFPDGEAPQGATVSGTASFAIDATAPEPLLLEIRPPSLPAGVEPAVILIEGPLQDFAAFD